MKPKLLYFLLIVFIFCTGTKSHAQREIHLLEPMFTYDYALKYYGNLSIKHTYYYDYFQLEDFKTPLGVKKVNHFEKQRYYIVNPETVF